ncbi:TetR/AcrR family transcriptional regulator [Macromonas nakdongensis]|uniref:TetR/AcrR family transcriptional regulator n=1 Tax=Macromonas nakdongensis TaxID=1843082 RepID=UPI000C338360|nr:TetR/AcrR family transcriptional regulator [Macromonas nakdongensis]
MVANTRIKLKTEDRQAELVQAALGLAAQRSPAEITTGDLALAIGITQGGVFRHFDNKEAIWLAVLDWAHQSLMERLEQAAQARQTNALQALRAVFMAHIGFVEQYPGVPRLVFQELQHAKPTPLKGRVQQLMADYRTLVAQLLDQAREERLLANDVDLRSAVVLFMGAVQGLVMQSLVTGNLQGLARQGKAVFNIYEAGLLPKPKT